MIKRLFYIGGGEEPQVQDDFNRPQNVEIIGTKGFASIPDSDDEVVVLAPYGNDLDRVIGGVVQNINFGLNPGDRLIWTDNAIIKLDKTGKITITSNGKDIDINAGSGTVNITATNINLTGTNIALIGNGTLNGLTILT